MKNKIKIAVSSPEIKLCTPEYNARVCAEAARAADASGADVIVFPELTLSGATAGDLFRFDILSEDSYFGQPSWEKVVSWAAARRSFLGCADD